MARTRATSGSVVGGKATRKGTPKSSTAPRVRGAGSSSATKSKSAGGGGNRYCPRETPTWQKEISQFFGAESSNKENVDDNIIENNVTDDSGLAEKSSVGLIEEENCSLAEKSSPVKDEE